MKKEDNITQLYNHAFSDFSVSAPTSVYKKVQRDLKRKSLLTLDPTRLNVFYLVLLSGAVAWAILGNYSAETAELNRTPRVVSKVASVIQQEPTHKEELSSFTLTDEEAERVETVEPLLVNRGVKESSRSNLLARTSSSQGVGGTTDLAKNVELGAEEVVVEELTQAEMLSDITETIEENTIDEEVVEIDLREKITLNNTKVESANEFMRLLALDSDKKGALTIRTKKK